MTNMGLSRPQVLLILYLLLARHCHQQFVTPLSNAGCSAGAGADHWPELLVEHSVRAHCDSKQPTFFKLFPPSTAADPGARTTDASLQDACLRAAAALGRPLFTLFSHPAARVADGAAVLMRAIAECGAAAAAPMRDAALREGALLHHLQLALFASGNCSDLLLLFQRCVTFPCFASG